MLAATVKQTPHSGSLTAKGRATMNELLNKLLGEVASLSHYRVQSDPQLQDVIQRVCNLVEAQIAVYRHIDTRLALLENAKGSFTLTSGSSNDVRF